MRYRTWMRIALGYLALVSVQIGLWAQIAPRSFFDHYPGLGRTWVRVDGPFNEHLVRDVGGLNLALAAVLIAALVTLSRSLIVAAAVASLLYGLPHFVYHVANLDGLEGSDAAAVVAGLAIFAAVPVALLVASRRPWPSSEVARRVV